MSKDCLVILSPGFPDGEQDTSCMPYFQMFLKALTKSFPELEIQIISFQYPFSNKTFQWNGCTIHSIGGKNKKWNRFFTWRKAKKAFQKIQASHSVKGILSLWLTECTYIGQRLSKQYNIQQIAWTIGQDVKKNNRYISMIDFSKLTTVCMSPFLQEQLLLNHSIKSNGILSNSIDPSSIPTVMEEERSIDILSVGSLSDFKRFDWIVDCVAQLKVKHSSIKAVIVGAGNESEKILQKIKALNLSDHIILSGSLPHHECLKLMMQSKVLLHPSSFEGASTVVLEALYYKCYVISVTVPHDPMPSAFFRVNSQKEMIKKTEEVLSLPENKTSYCVSTCEETARKLIDLFKL